MYFQKRQSASGKSVVGGGQKPSMAPPARLSRLVGFGTYKLSYVFYFQQKQSPADEFGFNLHAERGKGHFIGSVDKGGIADRAGLVMGQRIVGVNDSLIYPNTPHKVSLTILDSLQIFNMNHLCFLNIQNGKRCFSHSKTGKLFNLFIQKYFSSSNTNRDL